MGIFEAKIRGRKPRARRILGEGLQGLPHQLGGLGERRKLPNSDRKCILDALKAQKTRIVSFNSRFSILFGFGYSPILDSWGGGYCSLVPLATPMHAEQFRLVSLRCNATLSHHLAILCGWSTTHGLPFHGHLPVLPLCYL